MRMALLAEPLPAREAYDAGLVSHVVADADFDARAGRRGRRGCATGRRWPRRPPSARSTRPRSRRSSRRWSWSGPRRPCCCAPPTSPRGCGRSPRSGARRSRATERRRQTRDAGLGHLAQRGLAGLRRRRPRTGRAAPASRTPRAPRRARSPARSSRSRSRTRRRRSTSRSRSQSASATPSVARPSKPEYAAACSPLRKIASKGCGSRLGWKASPSVPTTQCTGQESTKSGCVATSAHRGRCGGPWWRRRGRSRRLPSRLDQWCRLGDVAATRRRRDRQGAALAEVVLDVDDDQCALHASTWSRSARAARTGSAARGGWSR